MQKDFEEFRKSVPCAPSHGKNLKWLIVVPRMAVVEEDQYGFPLGIAYVSSALKATGRNVYTLHERRRLRSGGIRR